MKRTDGLYKLYRLMLSGCCTAHITRDDPNNYCFEIRRYFPREVEERTIQNVMQYYYVTLTPDGVTIVAGEIEK